MSESVPIAYQGELMLAGWNETHNGGAKVTFWLPNSEALEPFKTMTVRKGNTAGQRLMAALVMVGDDEEPVPVNPVPQSAKPVGGALAKSAALVCHSTDFQRFVNARTLSDFEPGTLQAEDAAADYMREYCGVESRAELDSIKDAADSFRLLMGEYREWMNSTTGAKA